MRTVGVDLAAQPKKTGLCTVEWQGASASVRVLSQQADDDAILAEVEGADACGIDAPFGWPVRFVALLSQTQATGAPPWTSEWRDQLRFRETDHVTRGVLGRWPLSVSSDRIAIAAMRCHGLLQRLAVSDRSGDGRVFEVYPAVALRRWGMTHKSYKGKDALDARQQLVAEFVRQTESWLDLGEYRALCEDNDDAFDALVCALVVRAAKLGMVQRPEGTAQIEAARIEGWIAIPAEGSLSRLTRG